MSQRLATDTPISLPNSFNYLQSLGGREGPNLHLRRADSESAHRDGHVTVRGGAIAEFAVRVFAPAPNGATCQYRARVVVGARSNSRGIGDARDRDGHESARNDRTAFGSWWEAHAERMHARTSGVTESEIDDDVSAAFEETRSERSHNA